MTTITVADLPRFTPASQVAAQLGISLDTLYRASDAGQFARYYLFGKRKYYRVDEVAQAIREQVPGDPQKWRRVVAAVDAAAPCRANRGRRATPGRSRGSSEATA